MNINPHFIKHQQYSLKLNLSQHLLFSNILFLFFTLPTTIRRCSVSLVLSAFVNFSTRLSRLNWSRPRGNIWLIANCFWAVASIIFLLSYCSHASSALILVVASIYVCCLRISVVSSWRSAVVIIVLYCCCCFHWWQCALCAVCVVDIVSHLFTNLLFAFVADSWFKLKSWIAFSVLFNSIKLFLVWNSWNVLSCKTNVKVLFT